jgi:hypothetical protein
LVKTPLYVCNYYTCRYFPGGRECAPNFWEHSSWECKVTRKDKRWKKRGEISIKEERGKGEFGIVLLMSATSSSKEADV